MRGGLQRPPFFYPIFFRSPALKLQNCDYASAKWQSVNNVIFPKNYVTMNFFHDCNFEFFNQLSKNKWQLKILINTFLTI